MTKKRLSIPHIYLLYAALACAGILSVLMFSNFDTDVLWHYKIGELILQTKDLSSMDTFSWQSGLNFIKHEWLYEVFIYLLLSTCGTIGYFTVNVILLTGVFYGGAVYNKTKNCLLYLIAAVIGYTFTSKTVGLRPAEFSIFLLILMVALYKRERKSTDNIIFLIIGIFLANFHGGTILTAAILLVLYLMIGVFVDIKDMITKKKEEVIESKKEQFKRYAKELGKQFSPILSFVIGTFANPYGIILWKVAFEGPFAESTAAIQEWKPTAFTYVSGFFLLLMVLSYGYSLAKHGFQKKNLQLFGLLCAIGLLGMTSRRCCMMYLFFWLFFGYNSTEEMIFDFFGQIPVFKWRPGEIASALFTLFFLCITFKSFDVPISFYDYAMNEKSSKIIETLKEHSGEKILHGYTSGNYLLFEDIKCFIDSRQHPYAKEMGNGSLDHYLKIETSRNHKEVEEFLNKYDFDYIYISDDFDIKWYLEKQTTYELLYEDTDTHEQLWVKQ